MTSEQYEELCRRFIAQKTGKPITQIQSVLIPNPKRPGLPEYKHQIDLYWETGDEIALYLNIANAKWRSSAKVDQGEVMLLQQVRQKTGAHKAFMLTNVGFTAGAIAAARDDGIALHTVGPAFNIAALPQNDRQSMQDSLAILASKSLSSIFTHRVENRGLDFKGGVSTGVVGVPGDTVSYAAMPFETRIVAPPTTGSSRGVAARPAGAVETRGGGSFTDLPGGGRGGS